MSDQTKQDIWVNRVLGVAVDRVPQLSTAALDPEHLRQIQNIVTKARGAVAVDRTQIKRGLNALRGRVRDMVAAEPAQRTRIADVVQRTQSAVRDERLEDGMRGLATLRRRLDSVLGPEPRAVEPGVAFTNSRLKWDAARKELRAGLESLESAIRSFYAGKPNQAAMVLKAQRLQRVMAALDERLLDTLDAGLNAPLETRPLHAAAAASIAREYVVFVESDKLMKRLDRNPFMPLSVVRRLRATLYDLLDGLEAVR